ncbi:hypothetical protein T07_2766 [Trichinella nelsoni]|uniref:Uncharacterized protein n=1 Tax=Trichinella nelsoni TaxID=6336 RepID=A0A0V0RYQ6_9BILA|nr:hypothetical protein T07_2766 [Trichinella nelsoni]
MNLLNSAWNSIDANTVINYFNKSGFFHKLSDSAVVEDTDESVTVSKEWQQIAGTNVTFSDYVDCDSSLFAFQQSLLKEILEQHQADANQEDNDDDGGDKEEGALPIPTLTAALEAMDTVRRYVCSFNVDENVINQLSKIDTVETSDIAPRRCRHNDLIVSPRRLFVDKLIPEAYINNQENAAAISEKTLRKTENKKTKQKASSEKNKAIDTQWSR